MNPMTTALSKGAGSIALKVTIVVAAAVGGAGMVASNVFAALTATATNTSGGSVTSGTLKLTLAPSGVANLGAGLTTAIPAIGPGDTFNRFIDLTNGGTLDGMTPTLQLSTADSNTLVNNATTGLQILIKECTVAYTTVTGACSGTETTVLASTSAATLKGAAQNLTFANGGALTAAGVTRLKISITLPASTENTLNGTLPVGTIQGLTAALTWSFVITDSNATPSGTVA